MSERIPSPALIHYLLSEPSRRQLSLKEILDQLDDSSSEESRVQLKKDLQKTIDRNGGDKLVKNIAKPVVLCLFDDGQQGKTTFAHLLSMQDLAVFSTDTFVASLKEDWHQNSRLKKLATETVPDCVNEFIKIVESDGDLADQFVDLFFHPKNGFSASKPVSIIEGYLHNIEVEQPAILLDIEIEKRLRQGGHRVWVASRFSG